MSQVEINAEVSDISAPELEIPPFSFDGIRPDGSVVMVISPKMLAPLANLASTYEDAPLRDAGKPISTGHRPVRRRGRRPIFMALSAHLHNAAKVAFEDASPEDFNFTALD